jgi:hypothetical protein
MANFVKVRNLTSYRTLDFVDGTAIAAGAVGTIDLDHDAGTSEQSGDRSYNAIRRELDFYLQNKQAAVVGADS